MQGLILDVFCGRFICACRSMVVVTDPEHSVTCPQCGMIYEVRVSVANLDDVPIEGTYAAA